ncbi:FkbM family methyltransferase [Paenochrobactrum glaciei]|uniref:FkbM family methyltransferase n=1 Tax=Paenochrobactrum glaciei TaxID=486407 RepID=UPI0035BBA015
MHRQQWQHNKEAHSLAYKHACRFKLHSSHYYYTRKGYGIHMVKGKMKIYQSGGLDYLLTDGPDFISNHLRQGRIWEELTLNISKALIKDIKEPVLVDIGANLGAWSVPMGYHIHPIGGTIHAFEPQRPVFYQLCANYICNNLTNCYANNLAIGDFTGFIDIPLLDIFECKNLGALSISEKIRKEQGWITNVSQTERVRISSLDDLQLPTAHLIKVDVEGLEFEVFKGGKNWLKQSGNPPILFEVWGDYMANMIPTRQKLMHFLQNEMGYELFQYGELCIGQHQNNQKINIGALIGQTA